MLAPHNVSYFSRFLLKFVEIIAAGLATAASGYLIAHLSGVLSSPPPAPATAVFPAPNESVLSGLPAPPAQPASPASPSSPAPPAQPIAPVTAPVSADINHPALAPAPEPNAPHPVQTAQPAHPAPAKATPPAKRNENAAKETTHDQDSLAAQVRAALANADANHTEPPPDSALHAPHEPLAQPRPLSGLPGPTAVGAAPPAAPRLQPAPVQETPVEINPLTTEEITSHPVAGVQPPPETPDKGTGVLSRLDHLLREGDPLAGAQEAPRPPMPVGE
jgi:hypothetical protein